MRETKALPRERWKGRIDRWMPICFLACVLAACSPTTEPPVRLDTTAMDTFVSVTVFDGGEDRAEIEGLIRQAFREIGRVEEIATDYSDSSEVGMVNTSAGKETVSISTEIAGLIRESFSYSTMSDGAFDVTIGPMVKKWDFLAENPVVPSEREIHELLPLVNYKLVVLSGARIFLPLKGMRLDLGGIAKGYAVDNAIHLLRRKGLKEMIVDIGGNLGIYWEGTHLLDSTKATIYIRHPRRDDEFFGSFDVGTGGVSTSGDYQRFLVHEGVRYHHILDPKTGQPVRTMVSVTVVAPTATMADALSTTAFVLGREKGMRLIEELPEVDGIMIFEQGDSLGYSLSSGLQGKFVRSHPN